MIKVRLIYYSRAMREMSLADLKSILDTARNNNKSLNICGMLCYERQYFLQALEGERESVNELYLDIADDYRHDDIVIIGYDTIETPTFPEWNMGYAGSSSDFTQLLSELGQTHFSPDLMTQEQALSFLKKMSEYQTEI